MQGTKYLYRRVSVTQADGTKEKYDARVDIEADPETGVVTHKVYSQVLTDRYVPFRSTGNAAEDTIHFERVCQQVYEFDQSYRVRAVPKPGAKGGSDEGIMPQFNELCGTCGGYGWIEDETGYPETCGCRNG